MNRPVVGAHDISMSWGYSVLRGLGVFTVVWSLLMGLFLMVDAKNLFDTKAWVPLVEMLGGPQNRGLVGLVLLIGGLFGVMGLVTRTRALSLVSALVGVGWCFWLSGFLAVADSSVISGFAPGMGVVFAFRFALLVRVPRPGEDVGPGW